MAPVYYRRVSPVAVGSHIQIAFNDRNIGIRVANAMFPSSASGLNTENGSDSNDRIARSHFRNEGIARLVSCFNDLDSAKEHLPADR